MSDLQKAQDICMRAFLRVAKLSAIRADGMLFMPIVLFSYSRAIAEVAAEGQLLLNPGGVDKIVEANVEELRRVLLEDLNEVKSRLLAEATKAIKQ